MQQFICLHNFVFIHLLSNKEINDMLVEDLITYIYLSFAVVICPLHTTQSLPSYRRRDHHGRY